jgi:hypothetical protein
MIAEADTYLPPICAMTSAYSFSAPMAVILVADAAAPVDVPPAEDDVDEQAVASSAAASGADDADREDHRAEPGQWRVATVSHSRRPGNGVSGSRR